MTSGTQEMTSGAKGITSGAKLLTSGSGRRSKYYKFNTSIFSHQNFNSIEMCVTTNIYIIYTAKLPDAPLPQYSYQMYSFFLQIYPLFISFTMKKKHDLKMPNLGKYSPKLKKCTQVLLVMFATFRMSKYWRHLKTEPIIAIFSSQLCPHSFYFSSLL